MKQQNIIKGWFARVLIIAGLALGIFLGASVAQAQAKGDQIPASWEYQLDGTNTQNTAQFSGQGITTNLQALGGSKYRLVMSGNQGIEQVRQVLYSPLVDGFTGGVAEIEINLPVSHLQEMTLKLQANLTTGSYWRVIPESGFMQVGQPTFSQSSGLGASSVETLVIQPQATGNGTIKLDYRRSFGPIEAATRHLRIDLVAQFAAVDLSNPAPTFNKKLALSNDLDTLQTPGEQLQLSQSLPALLDWRTAGIVPAVRDQGQAGSCWAFGTVGVMESAIKKGGGPMTDLSEQFLVSCNTAGWDGIDGGWTAHMWHFNKLGYNQTAIGAVLESAMPYSDQKPNNGPAYCQAALSHPYKLSSWAFVTGSEDTMPTVSQIKTAIYTYGPITAGVCADNGWDNYSGGVYAPTTNECDGSTNHQIILVGWDDATSSWILRNSWGPGWGENGYMRIRWDPTGTTSRVGEGTSWVRWTKPVVPVPVIKAPIGTITVRKPTYKWTKISGATQYRYRVLIGTALVYTKIVPASVCGPTLCSNTPLTLLRYSTYRWQVQALVGGVWKPFSPYTAFSVTR